MSTVVHMRYMLSLRKIVHVYPHGPPHGSSLEMPGRWETGLKSQNFIR